MKTFTVEKRGSLPDQVKNKIMSGKKGEKDRETN